ncbi:hypothetical protein [Bradyrhizobium cenepequi]
MFVRLTRRKRVQAGWFIALLYLFCMLAPGAALALGSAAPALQVGNDPAAAAPVHDHSGHGAAHQHDGSHAAHQADADGVKHKHDDKTSQGPCCAMLCLSAIAADLPAIARPAQPVSLCVSENFQRLPHEAPPLLYRPPIA